MITLSQDEERLVETFRLLTPTSADQFIAWIDRLRELGNGKRIDWSDSWSEEDIEDLQRSSMAEFESGERDES